MINNMKKLVLSIAMVLAASFTFGQELTKEELKQQKRQIKALMNVANDAEANLAVDPTGAANAMRAVIASPLVNTDAYVWYVSANAKKGVVDEENRKRAEGAAFDEEKLYSYAYEFGHDIANCDKYDNMPDAKGRVKPKYTEFINVSYGQEFGQFYNAGAYYYGKEDYAKAYDLFAMFIHAADRLFECGLMATKDTTNTPVAAYNMALCGMQMKDYEKVLASVDMAMMNPDMAPSAFRYKTVAHLELGDTAKWIECCMEGAAKYPKDAYFNQSLIQYYDSRGENDKLDALANELIAADPTNPLFVYLKGYIAHQKKDADGKHTAIDTAIEWYVKTLEVDPSYENALNNLAQCYMYQAYIYSNEQSSTKITDKKKLAKDKEILNGYYSKALPLLEKLREMNPDQPTQWIGNLMNCYYNLNMADKVKELEKIQESLGY